MVDDQPGSRCHVARYGRLSGWLVPMWRANRVTRAPLRAIAMDVSQESMKHCSLAAQFLRFLFPSGRDCLSQRLRRILPSITVSKPVAELQDTLF
jgi:hypothetical protein